MMLALKELPDFINFLPNCYHFDKNAPKPLAKSAGMWYTNSDEFCQKTEAYK